MHTPDDNKTMDAVIEELSLEDMEYFLQKLYRALKIEPLPPPRGEFNWKRILKPLKQLTTVVEMAEIRKLI